MDVKNMFIWYQQKIGTYDKQKWETNIEQREQSIYGLTHIQTRSTKPNTNLIDLDLVRGSSFTKAKPQHGFFKVVKLATMRCIFYPFYGRWWIGQTSIHIFLISLVVYISHIFNVFIYFKYLPVTNTSSENLRSAPSMEIVVPLIMMWILSLIHSQIVATSPLIESKNVDINRRPYKRNSNNIKRSNKTQQNVCASKACSKKEDVISEQSLSSVTGRSNITSKRFQETSLRIKHEEKQASIKRHLQKSRKKSDHIISDLHSVVENKEGTVNNGIHKSTICSTDSESEIETSNKSRKKVTLVNKRSKYAHAPTTNISSTVESQCESEDELIFTPENIASASEWMGVTTNSEDCSYSSDIDNISESNVEPEDCIILDNDLAPTAILNPPCFKVSCTIWERNEIKKANLSVLDISSAIIGKVDSMPECMDYFYFGVIVATVLAFLPIACRLLNMLTDNTTEVDIVKKLYHNITLLIETSFEKDFTMETYRAIALQILQLLEPITGCIYHILQANTWDFIAMVITSLQRWILATIFFFLLCVAERTFKQRLLYAKLFSHLTSLRRAKKSDLPHFRLNKVRNIKTWLSVRSYLKKRGPQRSVDVIVSTAFVVNLLLLIFLCVELLKDTVIFSQYYLEALIWCLGLGTLLLRFMTLGTKINRKYRNLSVLITEQINLYLQIEQKPHKKDEFTVANNVLKLAIDLLKELENPFKIYGLSANPILYNVTKLVILSALSGVLSEMLGFKLKLHKIKIK